MSSDTQVPRSAAEIRALLNEQAAVISWRELQRFFASGVAIVVERSLNLLDVAVAMTRDDSELLQPLLAQGLVAKVCDEQAGRWLEADVQVWSVVVAPWVLVQETAPERGPEAAG